MELIRQEGHPKACILACIAMVEGATLDEVIRVAGSDQPPSAEARTKIAWHFGREEMYQAKSYAVAHYSDQCLAQFMRDYRTLMVSLSSCVNPNFAHCAVLHEGNLYDPHYGYNPMYPWDITIMRVSPIPGKIKSGIYKRTTSG